MARRGDINIPIGADTSGVEKAIRNGIIEPVKDADEALDKLGSSGSGDDIARDMNRAQAATRKLDNELDDARAELKKLGYASRDAGGDVRKGMDRAKEGVSEFKDEAKQSGREAAASFSGGFEDVADFVQETLANALSGFGPAGAAAGIALAAVVGSVLNEAALTQERLQAARERAADLASTLYDNKGALPLSDRVSELFDLLATEAGPQNNILTLIDGWVDFGSTLDAVKRSARLTGLDVRTLMDSLTGSDLDQASRMLEGVNTKIKELESNVSTAWAWDENLRGLRDTRDEIQKNIDAQRLAAELAETSSGRAASIVEASQERQRQAADQTRARVDELSQAWENAATDASSYFTTSQDGATTFDWSAYLTNAEATLTAANEYKARIVGLPEDIAAEATRVFSSQGAVAANEYVKAYESASAADQGRFTAAAAANGEAAGAAAAEALKRAATSALSQYAPPQVQVKFKPDLTDINNLRIPNKVGYVNFKAAQVSGVPFP